MKKNSLAILVGAAVVILLLIGAVIYFIHKSNEQEKQVQAAAEIVNMEKSQIEKEYTDLSTEFDGYTSTIKNDSLLKLFENEKLKVKSLLDELRTTKATDAIRIAQLKRELATVRKVMIMYVNQIDSLNSANKTLRSENVEVRRKFSIANDSVKILSKERQSLHEVVTRASMLEISAFSMTPLNKKNRKTERVSQMTNLQFNFTIAKNVTAKPGEKTIYLRITKPDDDVMVKSDGNVFPYEGRNIPYSAKKSVEFAGDALSDVIYWQVEEILQIGTYRAEFFVDDNRIGSFTFKIEKNKGFLGL